MSSLLTNLIRGCHKIFNPIFLMNPNQCTSEVYRVSFNKIEIVELSFIQDRCGINFDRKSRDPFTNITLVSSEMNDAQFRGVMSREVTFYHSFSLEINDAHLREVMSREVTLRVIVYHSFSLEINDAQLREVMSREVTIFTFVTLFLQK